MAKYRNGILGPVSGKIGDKVAFERGGKTFLRSVSSKPKLPPTENQLKQQGKFGACIKILQPVRDILGSFGRPRTGPTGLNLAVKYNMAQAFVRPEDGNWKVDLSKLQFSRGPLSLPSGFEIIAAEGMLYFGWGYTRDTVNSDPNDQIRILIYDPESNTYLRGPKGLLREEYMAVVYLPEAFEGKDLHVYVYCISQEGRHSTTRYLGPVQSFCR